MTSISYGGSVIVECEFYKRIPHVSTDLTTPANGGKITVVDPTGAVLVSEAAMTADATGKYSYKYAPPNTLGAYTVKLLADDTTFDGKIVEKMFRVIAG